MRVSECQKYKSSQLHTTPVTLAIQHYQQKYKKNPWQLDYFPLFGACGTKILL
jgi:hypothetical protein